MTTESNGPEEKKSGDEAYWAQPVSKLKVDHAPAGAVNLNVEGRQVVGPLQGFGQLWQKTYWVRLSGAEVSARELIKTWKENFSKFWPEGSRFYAPIAGIAPGEVALINITQPGGMVLSTGIMVMYADEESFTFMTPEGHMLSGWITFSGFEEGGATVAQVQVLVRANDPLWEILMRLIGFKKEDKFWLATLDSLARHFGVSGHTQMTATVVDPRLQWSQAKNVWHNAAIRSAAHATASPIRWLRGLVVRGN